MNVNGVKSIKGYFGEGNKSLWEAHDAALLVKTFKSANDGKPLPILCDQGTSDNFLIKTIVTEAFVAASDDNKANVSVEMRMQMALIIVIVHCNIVEIIYAFTRRIYNKKYRELCT